jgi:glycosyltransferase involved in cell wall biosynthesis
MTAAAPKLSIIINYYNPDRDPRIEAMVRFCLECYAAHTESEHEIILVDGSGHGASDLESICAVRGWRCLVCPDKGAFSRIYNQGMNAARGDLRAWSASDIFVRPGWDGRIISEIERTGAWMAAPYLTDSDYFTQIRLWPFRMKTFRASSMTFNLNVLTKECVERVGLMDDRFTGNYNDIDYLVRIRRAGGEAIIVDAGPVLHVGRGTSSVASTFRLDQDRERFLEKYPEFRTAKRGWPYDLAARELNRSAFYRFLLRVLGRQGRPLYWLARFEPFFHAC